MIPTIKARHSPVSPADLDAFEKRHDVQLPAAYREFLLRNNGGEPFPPWVTVEDDGVTDHVAVDTFYAITGADDSDDLGYQLRISRDNGGSAALLPIAGAGDDSFFLDLATPAGAVSVGSGHSEPVPVAATFDDFLTSFDYPDDALPWMRLIHEGDRDGLRRWLAGGGDPNETSSTGHGPVQEAVFVSDVTLLQLLIDHGGKLTGAIRATARDVSSPEMREFLGKIPRAR